MKKKIILIVTSAIIIISKLLLFIPVHKTGGFAGVDKYTWINILEYNFNDVSCADCFNYQILYTNLFVELLILIIFLTVINLILMKGKRYEQNKNRKNS